MRVLFLNQYFPPDPAPTGVLLHELAQALERAGHEVIFVSSGEDYRAARSQRGRMRRELAALIRMVWKSLRAGNVDMVISASSPPCLLVAATGAAMWHRAESVHWVMDLYPEIAEALGELRPGMPARIITALMGWGYRRARCVVALDEDMANRLRPYGTTPRIIRPWVFSSVQRTLDLLRTEPLWIRPPADEPWTWIYSGNLGRGHEWETLLAAQAMIEQRDPTVRLLFQGGGPSRPAAQARAQELGLRRCEWRGYVDEAELPASLLACHACAVTQLPTVRGMLWPSKLGLLLTLPRPLIWIGPTESAIARELREIPHAGVFAPGAAAELAEWILARRKDTEPASPALDPREARAGALADWLALLSA